ncbi:hypothetical protein JHK87_015760 [Glycine soja]|nr:hypothetical protein JHK87_015760 [Glycine soja]
MCSTRKEKIWDLDVHLSTIDVYPLWEFIKDIGEKKDGGLLNEEMKGSGLRVKGMTRGLIIVVKEMEKEFVEAESIAAMV